MRFMKILRRSVLQE